MAKAILYIKTDPAVNAIPQMTAQLEKLLGRVEADIEAKKNLSPLLETQEAVERYLYSL